MARHMTTSDAPGRPHPGPACAAVAWSSTTPSSTGSGSASAAGAAGLRAGRASSARTSPVSSGSELGFRFRPPDPRLSRLVMVEQMKGPQRQGDRLVVMLPAVMIEPVIRQRVFPQADADQLVQQHLVVREGDAVLRGWPGAGSGPPADTRRRERAAMLRSLERRRRRLSQRPGPEGAGVARGREAPVRQFSTLRFRGTPRSAAGKPVRPGRGDLLRQCSRPDPQVHVSRMADSPLKSGCWLSEVDPVCSAPGDAHGGPPLGAPSDRGTYEHTHTSS